LNQNSRDENNSSQRYALQKRQLFNSLVVVQAAGSMVAANSRSGAGAFGRAKGHTRRNRTRAMLLAAILTADAEEPPSNRSLATLLRLLKA
jgi:hypothetical protein